MKHAYHLAQYANYLSRSVNRHGVHSPFLYEIIEKVFKGDKKGLATLENLRKELLSDSSNVSDLDLGAGSSYKSNKRTVAEVARQSASSPSQCMILFRLIQHLKIERVLELGSSVGISAAYMAHGGASVISIEGNPDLSELAKNTFKENAERLDFRCGPFDDLLPAILDNEGPFDLVYIDGNHREDATLRYFEMCLHSIGNQSILIFDDIHWSAGMNSAWNTIIRHPQVTLSVDIYWCGLVFFDKGLSKEHFTIRY